MKHQQLANPIEHHPVSVGLPATITIPRDGIICLYPFTKFFNGFEHIPVVRNTFGTKTAATTRKVLEKIKVEFYTSPYGYMSVSDDDGHMVISADYLRSGHPRDIYLDTVHELVHVKQHRDGKPLFDEMFEYVDRPTEIDAYRHAVQEARRIGYSEEELFKYLHSSWLTAAEVQRLAKHCGVHYPSKLHGPKKARNSHKH